jgi:hypothetical protein
MFLMSSVHRGGRDACNDLGSRQSGRSRVTDHSEMYRGSCRRVNPGDGCASLGGSRPALIDGHDVGGRDADCPSRVRPLLAYSTGPR